MNLRSFRIAFSIVLTPRNVRKLSVLKIFFVFCYYYYFPIIFLLLYHESLLGVPKPRNVRKLFVLKTFFFVFYSQFPQLNFLSSLSRLSLVSRNPAL